MVGIWLWVMIFLLVAIVCYSYLYIIEGDFQHSSGYVRYTLIGFAIIFLSHNFIVADKSSMKASIEMRVPLINKELVIKNFYEKDNELLDYK